MAKLYLGSRQITPMLKMGEPKVFNVDGYDFVGKIDSNGVLYPPSGNLNLIFNGVKDISTDCFYYEENDIWQKINPRVVSASFPDLERITFPFALEEAFFGSRVFEELTCNALKNISGNYAFAYCCYGGTAFKTARFQLLESMNASLVFEFCFASCNNCNIYFNSLNANSFGSYTNQFYNMLQGASGATVHFPVGLDATIGNWSDVLAGFGGTNTTILYDL